MQINTGLPLEDHWKIKWCYLFMREPSKAWRFQIPNPSWAEPSMPDPFLQKRTINVHYSDVSNHWRLEWLLNRLFKRRTQKTSKLHVTGFCEENPPVSGGFPSQMASIAVKVSIWWCHHYKRLHAMLSLTYIIHIIYWNYTYFCSFLLWRSIIHMVK